jgi:hypothetical protein
MSATSQVVIFWAESLSCNIGITLEWRQVEWITTILGLENTQKETVCSEKNSCPDQDG